MQTYSKAKIDNRFRKKVIYINTCLYGSTGRIVRQLQDVAEKNGIDTWTITAYDRSRKVEYRKNDIVIGSFFSRYFHILLSRTFGIGGLLSIVATKKVIRILKNIKPDIIHLHNLHNAYINLPILFDYIKKNRIKIIWTLHDCWAFTGRCPYFDISKCGRWRTGCGKCPFPHNEYPISYVDNTSFMWRTKKKTYSQINDLLIVTPSKWLEDLVHQSFLKNCVTKVINNGIDLTKFRTINKSNIKDKLGIQTKYVVLGVALSWDRRKGLDVFVRLNELLNNDYTIVLVGVNGEDKGKIPSSIVCVDKTSSQDELAQLYSAADVFFNPTREDNFPTVNIEALACGTPVITFDTGGSPEMLNSSCGAVVHDGNYDEIITAIRDICEKNAIKSESCLAQAKHYDMRDKFFEYVSLYIR